MNGFLVYAPRSCRIALAVLFSALACGGSSPATPLPNVLLYVVDTLRADRLGAYGNTSVPTPHIDAIAREGVVFEQATSPSSWTRASMATLLTGLLPPQHGALDRTDPLPGDVTTLGERLSRRGYATGFVTSNPNVGSFFGFARGFDVVTELYGRRRPGTIGVEELVTRSEDVTAAALDFIDSAARPFFLVVLSIDPHSPYEPPTEFVPPPAVGEADIDGSQATLQRKDLGPAEHARIRSLYEAEIAYSDAWFGALVDGLRERGDLDDTLLVFTSDHGEELWERGIRGHGRSLAEAAIRIPLVIRHSASDRIVPGTRRSDPAGLEDVLPTVLDLIDPGGGEPGSSGAAAWDELPGRALFASATAPPAVSSLSLDGLSIVAAREYPWKLVWDRRNGATALYDLANDPLELAPVAPDASPQAAAAHARLRDAIAAGSTGRPAARRETVGPLPDDVEATLRALGYLDDDATTAPAPHEN